MSCSALKGTVWLTRDRAIAYATILAIAEIALFTFYVAGTHGLIVPLDHQPSTDFVSFYAAGKLADAGTPWLAYDQGAHQAAEQAAVGFATDYNYFYYPPVFLLICAPLALLSYFIAFVLFQLASAVACFSALRLIRRDLPPVVFLAYPSLWWAVGTGQNALLTAALFATGTGLLERRPWLAGLCLGALCYKPHFGLLIPVALLSGGHWRVFMSAAGAVSLLVLSSAILFGTSAWAAFIGAALNSGNVYAAHAIFMDGMTSLYGALMTAGVARETAFASQAVVTLLAGCVVAVIWRSRASLALRSAVLLVATPIAVPVLMFYDLMLVFVALVWLSLVPAANAGAWRTRMTAAVFLGPLLSGNLLRESHLMLAFLTAASAFGLTLAIAWGALACPKSAVASPVPQKP
jgi:alpha-1,2-mannosyltransferase